MDAATAIRRVRRRRGLSLRELARRAGTSHSTLSAYEGARVVPSVATLNRVLRAAGYSAGLELIPEPGGPDPEARGRELVEVLELAEEFPARHAPEIEYPRFEAP